MNHLCTTQLWNKNISNSPYPYLTDCFRNTVLQWIPMSIFWMILPWWFYAFTKQQIKSQKLPISILFVNKMIFTVLFLLVQILRIIHYVILSSEEKGQAYLLSSIFYIITANTILFVLNYDRLKGIFSSGLLFIFWFFVFLASIPDLIDYSIRLSQQIKSLSFWIEFISVWFHFIFTFGSLITNCFAEKQIITDRAVVPELYVSFPSRIFYGWVTPLILRGYKKPLTENDCWELPVSEKTVTIVHLVGNSMKEKTNITYQHKLINNDKLPSDQNHSQEEHRTLLNGIDEVCIKPAVELKMTSLKCRKTSVFWLALFRTYREKIIVGGLLRLFADLCQFSGPMILKFLLNFFMDSTKPQWLGIFYAILLSLMVFCQIILLRAHFQCQFIVGLRFRSAIVGLIYRKSLRLSNSVRQETTTGEIVNLMAIDGAHFGEITTQMHMLWLGPIQLIIALILLYQQMQLAIVPSVVLLLIMIPINAYLQKIQKQLTTKQMIVKDQRIKLINEILNGIRVLKLYVWEEAFIRSVTSIREKELGYIRKKAIISAISNILSTFTPILVGIMTFGTYILLSNDNILTADKAFVSLGLFNLLRIPLNAFPNVINSVIEAHVSNKRIQTFLNKEEIVEDAVDRVPIGSDGYSVKIEHGSFYWSNLVHDSLTLKNINLKIPQGSLVALVGMIGSGKSSILAALLGEMNKIYGHVSISGKIAYVPQTAWMMNATLRENILFGQDFDKKFYDQVIETCALEQDLGKSMTIEGDYIVKTRNISLDMLPARDQTEIGEMGINLSGGQRQRVSLARALYSRADIYLLDDPLSAVDAHVGAHIFKHAIGPRGLLNGKTRLLVTHGVSYLNKCDNIIVVSQGEIVDQGSYNDLIMKSKILRDFVHSIVTSDTDQYQRRASNFEYQRSVSATPSEVIDNPFEVNESDVQQIQLQPISVEIEAENKQSIEKEIIQTGSVKPNIFLIYIRACKLSMVALIVALFFVTIYVSLTSNIWLSKWTDKANIKTADNNTSSSSSWSNQIYDMSIYSALGIAQGILIFATQLIEKFAAYTAGRHLHWMILIGILHAPMSFFDTTPIGRIINRFAKEIDCVDTTLPHAFSQLLTTLITVITTLIILIYGSWFVILQLIPLALVFVYIQRLYISSSLQLRRLDSITRSSIYANFSETIQGLIIIRAYHAQQRFIDLSDKYMDRNQSCYLASSVANRWLGVRLEIITNLLTLFAATTAVFMRNQLTAGTVGLTITYALQITHSLNLLVRTSSDVETNIISVERINEYAELEPEAPWEIPETKPPPYWPMKGCIELKQLSTRYRLNLQMVVKDITISIQHGENIGIIGRTGSGKSSLCLTFFRILEPTNGTIMIDNIDIRLIGLHDLRSKITIIPQDAITFAGTVRFNVDPFDSYSDVEIWSVLELVHLKKRISMMENGLSHVLTGSGQNISAGERQLLCLARALLRKSKIFILDEATATIDMETDRLMQQTIRSALKDATVLTIAHRLHTILDSTKILVLSNGSVQEYDEPKRLAENPNSEFSKLLRDANIRPSDITSMLPS